MNMEAVKKSLQKLQQLGYFKIAEEPGFSVRPEDKKVDILIKGTGGEQEPDRVRRRLLRSRWLLRTVFLPDAQLPGPRRGDRRVRAGRADLQLLRPVVHRALVHGQNQTVGISLFRRNVEYLNIDEKRAGGTAFYGKGIGLFDSWSLLYAYEDIKANFPVRGAQVPPGQPVPPEKFSEVTGLTSSLTPGYRFDSRNDPFDPNRGYRLYADGAVRRQRSCGNRSSSSRCAGATIYLPLRFPRHASSG